MKKMTELVLRGLMAEDAELLINRIGEILEKLNLLECVADGVITSVNIHEEKFKEYVENNYGYKNVQVNETRIGESFATASVRISYNVTKYSENEDGSGWCSSSEDDKYKYPVLKKDSRYLDVNVSTPGITFEMI